ncbi:hypothetical protein [Mycoplasma sp. P36-A1]|uniref:hypothetical protein n=1 Tax=Mycoplasma sp. P36-A1 TaxID=3252900 RepID=UPI003C2E58B3
MNYYLLTVLIIMSINDYYKLEVSNILMLALIPLINLKIEVFIFFMLLLIAFPYISNYIGGADLKIGLIMYSILELNQFINWLLISTFVALMLLVLLKKKQIYMFPFFTIGYVLTCQLIWKCFLKCYNQEKKLF